MNQWPSITDAEGRSLLGRTGDLQARFWLNDLAESVLLISPLGCCTLIHAERYLSDRLAYELYPWPKGMILIEEAV